MPSKTLERQKSKKMIEDIKLATIKTTEVRLSNANISYNPTIPKNMVGDTEELPDFRRYSNSSF